MFLAIALVVLFVLFCLECVLTEVEHFGWATLTMVATLVGVQVFHIGGVDLLAFAATHVVETVLYVLGYVAVGVVWSFVKWFSFLMAFRDKYREYKENFLTSLKLNPTGQVPDDQLGAFREYMSRQSTYTTSRSFRGNDFSERPRANKNKSRIVAWMSFWPFSVVGTVLNDPMRRFFSWLFNQFKALYQQMSDRIFRAEKEMR